MSTMFTESTLNKAQTVPLALTRLELKPDVCTEYTFAKLSKTVSKEAETFGSWGGSAKLFKKLNHSIL